MTGKTVTVLAYTPEEAHLKALLLLAKVAGTATPAGATPAQIAAATANPVALPHVQNTTVTGPNGQVVVPKTKPPKSGK